ncbi:MAG: hypothetical protein NZ742_06065 [Acidobacteria bacterium]|nr:hypothetical protein [Acidobacteriota bacterium]MDW7984423.1 hypothetical protein [Acidobacteriota bacterium]
MTGGLGFWLTLALLGAYHGVNPAMGWLFAVALGLQERSRRAVVGALVPITIGHFASIGLVAAVLSGLQLRLPQGLLRGLAAAVLIAFGLYRLVRTRHPRWVGLRVGFRDLVLWSFLMATGHGAGLMLVPVLLETSPTESSHHHGLTTVTPDAVDSDPVGSWGLGLAAVAWHTAVYLLVMVLVAFVVYEKVGLAFLRRAWFNLEVLWAVALIIAGLWVSLAFIR